MSPRDPPGKLAVWLAPEGDARERLAAVIRAISTRFHTPCFDPHVTLVGGVTGPEAQVLGGTRDLAAALRPLRVTLATVIAREEYYQSLVMTVEPTRELSEARARARVVLGGRQGSPFFPHLSLMYGRIPQTEKEMLLRELGNSVGHTFLARSLEVVSVAGLPEDWCRIESFPLADRRRPRGPGAV